MNIASNRQVNVHKFGGSSLADAAYVNNVADIINRNATVGDYVVVSANGDTTDHLFSLFDLTTGSEELALALLKLEEQQSLLIETLLDGDIKQTLIELLKQDINQLKFWLQGNAEQHHHDILAFGELWSTRLLAEVLSERGINSYALDARKFLVVESCQSTQVDYAVSSALLEQNQQANQLAIITGYIARDQQGKSCTLGRNGSDYSATIVGALVNADKVTLWTDVDGVYSADPRIVPSARKLNRLPNQVAAELGRLGNPILHKKTLQPLTENDEQTNRIIHLHVASSLAPENIGTEVGNFGQIAQQELSITHQNDLWLIQSKDLHSEQGLLLDQKLSPICHDYRRGLLVIDDEQKNLVSDWLSKRGLIFTIQPAAIIAAVGYQVANRGDIKANFKRALTNVNPIALVSSTSDHSIIAVLADNCPVELLNNVHHRITKHARHIGLVVVGLGNIGQRFIELLVNQLAFPLLENAHLVGLVSSQKALLDVDGIDVEHALSLYQQKAQTFNNQQLNTWLNEHPYDDLVVVDITPSEAFSQLYSTFLAQGIHIICANKWAGSSATDNYQHLLALAEQNHCLWLTNTTVGAALPVNAALTDLTQSGHKINEISGIFSGTLSWLFQQYNGQEGFSKLLKNALAEGITEPDPRDDLSGRDVQRKLLILARIAGYQLELEDIDCQNLVPEHLQQLSLEQFLAQAEQLDSDFAAKLIAAQQNQQCLRYIAEFKVSNTGKVSAQVYLASLPVEHAFSQLTPGDNIFQINSQWYQDNPLIIRGPGAGRDVTAAGLHSDLITLCQKLANKPQRAKIKGINQ